jgi:hypothetical protein
MSTEYFVASNLEHDKKAFVRGDKITLSDEQAKPLLAVKTIQTRPIRKVETDEPSIEPETPIQARVGGESTSTGEPSVDGREATPETAADNDTTPEVGQGRTVRSVAGGNDTTQPETDPSKDL